MKTYDYEDSDHERSLSVEAPVDVVLSLVAATKSTSTNSVADEITSSLLEQLISSATARFTNDDVQYGLLDGPVELMLERVESEGIDDTTATWVLSGSFDGELEGSTTRTDHSGDGLTDSQAQHKVFGEFHVTVSFQTASGIELDTAIDDLRST